MSFRNVKQDPRAGDVVQVYPLHESQPLPSLLTVETVDGLLVHWTRNGEARKTPLKVWKNTAMRMDLVAQREAA